MSAKDDHLRELIAAEAAEHYVAQHDGDAGPTATEGLLGWLRRSPAHVAEYLGMVRLARDVSSAAKRLDIPLDRLVEDARGADNVVDLRNHDGQPRVPLRPPVGRQANRRWIAAGIVVAIMIGLATALTLTLTRSEKPKPLDLATARGEERTWRLADDTVVHLDSESRIRVTLNGRLRLVELDRGRAFFQVAKDTRRQFRVLAGSTVLQDVGTSFDVFQKDSQTIVTVVDGQVDVWMAGGSPSSSQPLVDLHAGQQATILRTGTVKALVAVNLRHATAWMRQEIDFDQDRIDDVAAEFNRYNDVQISVRDARVASIAITGTFHTYDLDTFVQFLNSLPDVKAVRGGSPAVVIVSSRRKSRGD
jgi:transmembrane sensor